MDHLLQEALEKVPGILRAALPDVQAIYVYGSAARGDSGPGSDVDVGVLLPPGQSMSGHLDIAARLAAVLGHDVDLVDLRRAGDFLRMEVLREGRALYVRDQDQLLDWEARAISSYSDHRYRIRGLLDDFSRTGVGYAP
jgi:uncharacterized protein